MMPEQRRRGQSYLDGEHLRGMPFSVSAQKRENRLDGREPDVLERQTSTEKVFDRPRPKSIGNLPSLSPPPQAWMEVVEGRVREVSPPRRYRRMTPAAPASPEAFSRIHDEHSRADNPFIPRSPYPPSRGERDRATPRAVRAVVVPLSYRTGRERSPSVGDDPRDYYHARRHRRDRSDDDREADRYVPTDIDRSSDGHSVKFAHNHTTLYVDERRETRASRASRDSYRDSARSSAARSDYSSVYSRDSVSNSVFDYEEASSRHRRSIFTPSSSVESLVEFGSDTAYTKPPRSTVPTIPDSERPRRRESEELDSLENERWRPDQFERLERYERRMVSIDEEARPEKRRLSHRLAEERLERDQADRV